MSPTKPPSAVTGLRKAVGTAAPVPASEKRVSEMTETEIQSLAAPTRTSPVRVTLNFPPDLFRQLDHWARETADAIGAPRVGVQDAVRAMVRVITSGEARNAEILVRAELRK
jgi:hypothetical protein